MNPIPIRKNVFLKIDKALVDEITTESGFKLYLAPEYNFETNATVTGTVENVPRGLSGVSKGDKVAFSYHVISNREFPNTSDFFVPISEGSDHLKIWQNSKGEKLRMRAHQGAISLFWVAVFFDSRGQFVQEKSMQGTEEQVERWLHTNFKFGNCEKFNYRNLLSIGGQEYWKCNYENIFAKKVKGHVVTVGDRVICKFIEIPIEQRIHEIQGIKLPEKNVAIRLTDRAEVISAPKGSGFKKGDIISFNERYLERYTLWNKEYALIKQSRVEGKWVEN